MAATEWSLNNKNLTYTWLIRELHVLELSDGEYEGDDKGREEVKGEVVSNNSRNIGTDYGYSV